MFKSAIRYSDRDKLRIVNKLIDMRHAGKFSAIYCDADRLRVMMPGSSMLFAMSWERAAKITGMFATTEIPADWRALVSFRRIA